MSQSCRRERSLISHEEYEAVQRTHHPAIYEVDDAELREIRKRLRGLHDRERTLGFQTRRAARGKADERGGSFPGTYQRPAERKQVFAAAVKRVNKELSRRSKVDARTTHVEAARKALAMRRAANFVGNPFAGETPDHGMQAIPSRRRPNSFRGQRIGSISQAVKASQARQDNR